jgi:LysR family transcriptional activator of nhaA
MTEVGQLVFPVRDEIFGLGRELQDALKGKPRGRALRFLVGISDLVPKMIAYRVLEPLLSMPEPVQLICHEDASERLLGELAEHRLDVVLSETPLTSAMRVKAFNHLLGACKVTLFGAPALAGVYRKNFPASLDGAPVPDAGRRIRPQARVGAVVRIREDPAQVVGEFKDRALMKTFGQGGAGVFPAPAAIENEVREHYKVGVIGHPDSLKSAFTPSLWSASSSTLLS